LLGHSGNGSASAANWASAASGYLSVPQRVSVALRSTEFRRPSYVFAVATLAALYYAGARIGYHYGFSGPVAAIVWLPVGIGIAFLTLAGPRYWPGALVGDMLVNNYTSLPFASAVGQSLGNLLEVLIAAIVIRRISRRGDPLAGLSGLVGLFGCMAAAVAVSATIGSLSLTLGGVIHAHEIPVVWRTWVLGDYAGALLVVPLALAWYRPLPSGLSRARALEALTLIVVGVWLTKFALSSTSPLLYLIFPMLIWTATRFGPRGATVGIVIAAGIAVWDTAHEIGTFHYLLVTHRILSVQLFIIVIALSTLFLSALLTERERLIANLHSSRSRLL